MFCIPFVVAIAACVFNGEWVRRWCHERFIVNMSLRNCVSVDSRTSAYICIYVGTNSHKKNFKCRITHLIVFRKQLPVKFDIYIQNLPRIISRCIWHEDLCGIARIGIKKYRFYKSVTDITEEGETVCLFAEYNQQDAAFHNLFISVRRSTCFRLFFRPSPGAQNCTYSGRYLSDHYCYLLLAKLAAGNSNGLTNTCRCMCSFELLVMDGKTVWNM